MLSLSTTQISPTVSFPQRPDVLRLTPDGRNAIHPTSVSQDKVFSTEPLLQNQVFGPSYEDALVFSGPGLDMDVIYPSQFDLDAFQDHSKAGSCHCAEPSYCTGHTAPDHVINGLHSQSGINIRHQHDVTAGNILVPGPRARRGFGQTELEDDSDSSVAFGSWTTDDDNASNLYFEINEQMTRFRRSLDEECIVIPSLCRSQRRIVHAMAHVMHLGHKSTGDGKRRNMVISKPSE